ncbi:hypothetical protein [Vibrio harveyi]|uniref:hypothetical protein n=1 Tax=Vibrio harveyi TaxID=669 RepID=UPI00195C977C|nr:hypothetical protein [Vibrio harveyi]
MEKILGLRVEPKSVSYAIIVADNGNYEIDQIDVIKIPAALRTPEQLKYVRNTVLDIVEQNNVTLAGLRVAEGNSQNMDISRVYIEGVIQESFSSCNVKNYFIGRKISISSKLGVDCSDYDEFVAGRRVFELVENWNEASNNNKREAVLVAMGVIG